MKRFTPIYGVALLPLLTGLASAAQPLTDTQMDKVTAGWSLSELDITNTSATAVYIYSGSPTPCVSSGCYLDLNISGVLAIQSWMLVPPAPAS